MLIHKGECLLYEENTENTSELVRIGTGSFIGEECVLFGRDIQYRIRVASHSVELFVFTKKDIKNCFSEPIL